MTLHIHLKYLLWGSSMKIFLYILFGFFAGIVGGMGMGGGTILVPLFSFLDVPQYLIQTINLFSFLPMCLMALVLHFKNKLVQPKNTLWIILPAVVTSLIGAIFAGKTTNEILSTCFGVFLVVIGGWQLVVGIKAAKVSYMHKLLNNTPTDIV